MKWLPIVRIEKDTAYVRTIRGIEPCNITNSCNNAEVGQYTLCKSQSGTLYMVEVET